MFEKRITKSGQERFYKRTESGLKRISWYTIWELIRRGHPVIIKTK